MIFLVHCFEQIRQYIMCSGDMTPIPTKYNHGRKHSYVDSDVPHTCRNFNVLREWLSARYNGSLAVQPICPGATKPEEGSTSCVLDEWYTKGREPSGSRQLRLQSSIAHNFLFRQYFGPNKYQHLTTTSPRSISEGIFIEVHVFFTVFAFLPN